MESSFPSGGGLVSQGPSEGRDSGTGASLPPREPTSVHLPASTVYVYLNRLLLNVIQQSVSSETPQTALHDLEFSKLDVALSPSFSGSRRSLPATSEARGGLG